MPVKTEEEQRGSVAGRGLPGDEGMLIMVQKSNK